MHPATTVLTDEPAAPRAAVAAALRRRWPALLAVGVAAALWGVDTATAGQLLPVLPLLYLVLAVVRRPQASWPALLVSVVLFAAVQAQEAVDPVLALTAVAAAVTLAGALRRGGRSGAGELALQVGGYALFAGIAAVALLTAPEAARWVLAAGWLGHGVWDLMHLRRRAVVSRSYAEWCAVLDVLMALQLLLVR